MRLTADGHFVSATCAVYEILYRYYNAEVSLAVPHLSVSKDVPSKYKIWRHYQACQFVCEKLNKKNNDGQGRKYTEAEDASGITEA